MTEDTIVAIYDTPAHAELAAADLKVAGIPAGAISVHSNAAMTGTTAEPVREQGFWSSLFGGEPDHDVAVYDRSLASGSTVVSVTPPEAHVAKVIEILESHQPIDIDERANSYEQAQTMTATQGPLGTAAATGAATSLQLSEETLAVGKRVVNRGGTRIRRFVVETPVEENVTLHSERVTLERHPVTGGRPVVQADFSDKTIEMTETSEEAVVSKTARVYEEVGLRKEVTDRTETIRDTVRKEEAEIERIPGAADLATGTAPDPYAPRV